MSEISLNEALNIAAQMANHFKAFGKAKEVLERVVTYEQNKAELEKTIMQLKKDIVSLQTQKEQFAPILKEATLQLEKDKQVVSIKLEEYQHQVTKKMQELDEVVVNRTKESTKKMQELDKVIADKTQESARIETVMTQKVKELQDAQKVEEQRLTILKEQAVKRIKELEATLTGLKS